MLRQEQTLSTPKKIGKRVRNVYKGKEYLQCVLHNQRLQSAISCGNTEASSARFEHRTIRLY